MLVTKGGGYSTLTVNNNQYSVRGDDALTNLIKDHFEEIRGSFKPSDFEITENKAFAEFDAEGNKTFEEEPGEEKTITNAEQTDEYPDLVIDEDE